MVILVNDKDCALGRYAPRHAAHTGQGLHHRAFVCLLFNRRGELLLQKRRHWLWDNLWDFSAVSHPLHVGGRDETYQEAAARALWKEMGIAEVTVRKVGGFNYFARHTKDDGCENEYCAILVGEYEGPVRPDPEDVYETNWKKFQAVLEEVRQHPAAYTPWVSEAVKTLEQEGKLSIATLLGSGAREVCGKGTGVPFSPDDA